MEPITNISQIPPSRWALVCSLCRERVGACIQCAVKTCKTAFHVTCAFQYGLELKTIVDDDGQDIHMKAFCQKHSNGNTEDSIKTSKLSAELGDESMTDEERKELRSHRLKKLAEEFYKYINPCEVAEDLQLDLDLVDCVCSYWILKRKMSFDRPLLLPKTEEQSVLMKQRETLIARMNMFIRLRQDLERVRNLCYMLNKREKMRSLLYQMKEELFTQESTLLESDESLDIAPCFAHRSTGTFYDKPQGIIDAAQSQLIRDELIDQKSSAASATPASASTNPVCASVELPQMKVRRSRLSTVQKGDAIDAALALPHISQIQQLFRDKMEGLESRGWAVASGSEVKTDVGDSEGEEKVNGSDVDTDATSRNVRDKLASNESMSKTPERNQELAVVKADRVQKQTKSALKKVIPDSTAITADTPEQKATVPPRVVDSPENNGDSCLKSENFYKTRVGTSNKLSHVKTCQKSSVTIEGKRISQVRAERRKSNKKNDENASVIEKDSELGHSNAVGMRPLSGDLSEGNSIKTETESEKLDQVAADTISSLVELESDKKSSAKVEPQVMQEVSNSAASVSIAKRIKRRSSGGVLDKSNLASDSADAGSTPILGAARSRLRRSMKNGESKQSESESKVKSGDVVTQAKSESEDVTEVLQREDKLVESVTTGESPTSAGKREAEVNCYEKIGDVDAFADRMVKSPLETLVHDNSNGRLSRGSDALVEGFNATTELLLDKCSTSDRREIISENKLSKNVRRRVRRPSAAECKTNDNPKPELIESAADGSARKPTKPAKLQPTAQKPPPATRPSIVSCVSPCVTDTSSNGIKDDLICFAKLEVTAHDVGRLNDDPIADIAFTACIEDSNRDSARSVEKMLSGRAVDSSTIEVNRCQLGNDNVQSNSDIFSTQSDDSCDKFGDIKEEVIVIDEDDDGVRNRLNSAAAFSKLAVNVCASVSVEKLVEASHIKIGRQVNVAIKQEEAENVIDLTDDDDVNGRAQQRTEMGKPQNLASKRSRATKRKESVIKSETNDTSLNGENSFGRVSNNSLTEASLTNTAQQQTNNSAGVSWISTNSRIETVRCSSDQYSNSDLEGKYLPVLNFGVLSNGTSEGAYKPLASGLALTDSFTFNGAGKNRTVSSADPSVVARKEQIRAVLMQRFLPGQLVVAQSIKQRVIDGLGKLAASRKSPVICRHTRQKLANCMKLDHDRLLEDIRCRGRLTSIRRQSCVERSRTVDSVESRRRSLPERRRRKTYSEWDYVCGDEFSSPLSDTAVSSDGESLFNGSDAEFQLSDDDEDRDVMVETERLTVKRRRGGTSVYR